MHDYIFEVIGTIIVGLTAVIFRSQKVKIDNVEKSLKETRETLPTEYATKTDLISFKDDVNKHIDRMLNHLDKRLDKIENKIDK